LNLISSVFAGAENSWTFLVFLYTTATSFQTATAEAQLLHDDFMAFSTLELWKLQLQLLKQKIEDGII
jgi:hypothetical protein